jgi:tetratricopeptide (TPR) repeat protein
VYDYEPNDVLLYRALFRCYRNAFVDHIRICMQLSHGSNAEGLLEGCFGNGGWEKIKAKVSDAQARGAVVGSRIDEFDYLDVAYFHQVVDHLYNDLVAPQWLGAQAKASKQQLLQWIKETKNARDPAAHPGTLDVDVADAIRAVDSALRVLKRLNTASGKEELDAIQRELYERAVKPVEIGSVAPLDDSLPSTEASVHFVGRGDELTQLRAWLRHPHKNRWMLVGDGGKGKTAIAYEFAREVIEAAPQGLCAAFWLSAKRRKYEIDRTVDIPTPDFTDLSDCLNRILLDYGHHQALDESLDSRREQVLFLLQELPCLLVVDDLDSVDEENEDVVEFLTLDAPQTRSKVLLTSRRKFAGMGSTLTPVLGLPEIVALSFVDLRWAHTGLDAVALSYEHRIRIVETCEGSPLYMGDLLRLCAVAVRKGQSNVDQVIDDWAAKDGETVRQYALQREMDMLTAPARRILEVLGMASRPMTLTELARVSGLTEHMVASAIEELRQLYLLSAPSLDEDTPRFAVEGNLALLVRAEIQGGPREQQIKNAIAAVEGKDVSESEAIQVRDLARQARLLLNSNRVADAEQLLVTALMRTPENRHLLAMLGMCYVAWQPRRNADARIQFSRAAELGYSDRGMYLAWSRIEGEIGDWRNAVKAAERGLAVRANDPMLLRAVGQARISLARQHLRALSRDKAEAEYSAADEDLEKAIDSAKRLHLRAIDISVMYKLWVQSAAEQHRNKAVCYRLDKWQAWKRTDRELIVQIAEHAQFCPDKRHRVTA